MTDSFKALSRGLSMPCTLERVVDVMVEFMENLWLRGIPFSVSDVFLAEMLDQICIAHKVSLVGPAVTMLPRQELEIQSLLHSIRDVVAIVTASASDLTKAYRPLAVLPTDQWPCAEALTEKCTPGADRAEWIQKN